MSSNTPGKLAFRLVEKVMIPVKVTSGPGPEFNVSYEYRERYRWRAVVDAVTDKPEPPDVYVTQPGDTV